VPLMVCGSKDDIIVEPDAAGWQPHLKEGDRLWECPQGRHFFIFPPSPGRRNNSQFLGLPGYQVKLSLRSGDLCFGGATSSQSISNNLYRVIDNLYQRMLQRAKHL